MPSGNSPSRNKPVSVVGIGASAGGLAPLRELIQAIPKNSGLAFVVIQHLAPDHHSHLAELLGRGPKEPSVTIVEVTDGIPLKRDHLYIIPPHHDLELKGDCLRLVERDPQPAQHLPIDRFFRAMARELASRAIGVILSGGGSDGTLGATEIKEHGGLVLVQDPAEAEFGSMPGQAIRCHIVDVVGRAAEIPRIAVDYVRHPSLPLPASPEAKADDRDLDQLSAIVGYLHTRTAYDFSHYKKNGLIRRVHRRMGLLGVETLSEYRRYLAEHANEPLALVNDLLIGATSFFRDRDAWEIFRLKVVEPLVAEKSSGETVRVWVPACATGEEAYTVTALIHEALHRSRKNCEVHVFATDIDEGALLKAREGVYPLSAAGDIPDSYLERYFHSEPETNRLRVDAALRESVVFARQNLLSDPPFSRLDLLLCRNLLIYLEPSIQSRVIELFHFALRPEGVLFLGSAESIGEQSDLYRTIDKKWRIYLRVGSRTPGSTEIPLTQSPATVSALKGNTLPPITQETQLEGFANRVLMERFCPAAVLVNSQYEALYFAGPTHDYLEHPTGTPTNNLLDLARTELRGPLRTLVHQSLHTGKIAKTQANALAALNARILMRAEPIRPDQGAEHPLILVTFETTYPQELPEEPEKLPDSVPEDVVTQLEYELAVTRQDLQNHIEQLKSVNEELQSANEELQISNEELETSREELQSVNEELTTVNAQLQDKIDELEETNDALRNFQTSSDVPTLFLDRKCCIRRFTPAISTLIELRPSDIGRPLKDFSRESLGAALFKEIEGVLKKPVPVEREVQTAGGQWFLRRVLPYRTGADEIDGVVVTFNDVSHLKAAQESLRRAQATLEQRVHERTIELAQANRALERGREELEDKVQRRTEELAEAHRLAEERAAKSAETAARDDAVLKSMSDGLVLADPQGNIIDMNPAALEQHEFKSLQDAQRNFRYYADAFDLLDLKGQSLPKEQWPLPKALKGEKFTNFVVQVHRFSTGRRWYANYSGTPVHGPDGQMNLVVLTIRDVTEIREAENALQASEQRFRSAVDSYPSPFTIYDAQRRIQFINPAGLRWLDLPEEEVLNRTDEDILPTNVTVAYLPTLLLAISRKERQTTEAEITWNNATRTLVISYVPLLDEYGRIEQVLGIAQDLSATVEAKRSVERLNADLRRRASELQIANRELESFAYSVSHDLRAPLRAISSFSSILREDYEGKIDAKADDYLQRISDSGIKMARLIDDLLNLSRITRHELIHEAVDFTELVEKITRELQGAGICSEETEITVEPTLTVVADRRLLRVALENLLRNACKFSGREEHPKIAVGRTEKEGYPVFFIRDNGVGFDMAFSGNLFKPFQRLHDPSDYDGTGIGLAIVQRVISRHGGRIWAESEPGNGATFYFSL